MKFTVNRTDITEAVSNIQRAVSSKTSVPALECILVRADEGNLELTAYDLSLGMTTSIPARVEDSGKAAIPARIFSEIVRKTPADTVTVEVDDRRIATIKSGSYRTEIITTAPEEFPEMPKIGDYSSMELSSSVLKSMIRQTLFAVAEGDAKPVHQGSLFHLENGQLDVVSVDGYRLAKRTEPTALKEDFSFVVPGKTLGEMLRLLKDTDDLVSLSADPRHILVKIDNYTIISTLLEGEFLNYKSAIPPESKTEVVVKTRELIDAVERVSLLITDRLKSPVRCQFSAEEIRLLCTTTMGRADDALTPEGFTGDPVEIGFNNRYLLDALRNTECDEVKIQLGGSLSPMKIVPKEGDSFLFLVLPVRLKSE